MTYNRSMRLVVAMEGMFTFGGTERQAVDIACGMKARGYDVTLLSRWPLDIDNIYLDELSEHHVRVLPRGWAGGAPRRERLHAVVSRAVSLGRIAALRGHAWRWQVGQLRKLASAGQTIVHEVPFFGDVSPQGVAAHRRIKLPVVHTILGTPDTPVQVVAPWAVVTSDGSPRLWPPERQFAWVPTMGPPATPLPARSPPVDGYWRGVFVGRLVSSKGVELLVRAWAQLPGTPQLTVIGDGAAMPAVADLVSGQRANIVLTGALKRPDVLRELERAHLLIAPSVPSPGLPTEGVPTVLAEAMWAGIPVVASRVGGVDQLFATDDPGWLFEPGDEEGMVKALMAAMNPTEYARAALTAHAVFHRLLAPTAVLDRYEVAYERAVAARV
jgi:hypothetical protein